MKVVSIIGTRPQFIKAATVSHAFFRHNKKVSGKKLMFDEIIIHTGQHFNADMSDIFFRELDLPKPSYNLFINNTSHGAMTGRMLMKIEEILIKENPNLVLVYGDTNSTLAGALASAKLHIPLVHIEAGLRSYNRQMPEEFNRVLTDHCSHILFCPSTRSIENLKFEGIVNDYTYNENLTYSHHQIKIPKHQFPRKILMVGDVMFDSLLCNVKKAEKRSDILKRLNLKPQTYVLVTVHRAENTDQSNRLSSILDGLSQIAKEGIKVIIPLHPRTRQCLIAQKLKTPKLEVIDPVCYLDMLILEKKAKIVLTDSGGVQKEAYWLKVPCVTLREETEWIETVEVGWNVLVGADAEEIFKVVSYFKPPQHHPNLYGDGHAAERIVKYLASHRLTNQLINN
ncbi:non-hydrolyzing UDP-N-acetylglucosamine 2-epimerase [Bacteroidota bacterium]